ncbi:MAG: hypothetical protein ACRDRT_14515 [Pseudonocardiaceae bacterium]
MTKRIIMTLIAAAAVGGFVFVFTQPAQVGLGLKPSVVESVFPEGGNLNLRQVTVVADLASGYTGYLLLDGVEVPRDDLRIVDALNSISLQPTPESDYLELEPGPHCATVIYHRIGRPESDSSSYRWCFSLA